MKKNIKHRIISGVLALVMLISFVPFGGLISVAEGDSGDDQGTESLSNVVELGKNGTEMLGWGYNALSGLSIEKAKNLISNSWIDRDSKGLKLYVNSTSEGNGVLRQYGEAYYSTSSVDYMAKLGIDIEQTMSASFPISIVKADVETKLGANFDMSTRQTKNEIYYRYAYKAICNEYFMSSDYRNHLDPKFIQAVNELGSEPEDIDLYTFFNTYGTHMLVSYDTGGELELTAWAISNDINNEFVSKITTSVKSKAEALGASAEDKIEIGLEFETNTSESNAESHTTYFATGGKPLYAGVSESNKVNIDEVKVSEWVDSVSSDSAFLPSSTEWVAIWEVLSYDVKYNALCERMYNYFMQETQQKNSDFIKKYCSYSSRITLGGYTYISPNGYVYQDVPLETISSNNGDVSNPVSPGSKVIVSKEVDESLFSIDEINYEIDLENTSGIIEVDRNGVISIGSPASGSFKLYIKHNDVTISIVEFTISADDYSGGYGTSSRPYIISNVNDLNRLANDSTGHETKNFVLINDIDFEGNEFKGISIFSGVLDGNGYRIYGFKLTSEEKSGKENIGFIGKNTGIIRNLIIGKTFSNDSEKNENPLNLKGINKATGDETPYSVVISATQNENNAPRYNVGALVGWNEGVIDNCRVENVFVYGCLKQAILSEVGFIKFYNTNPSYIYVGMVGTNKYTEEQKGENTIVGGVITRCYSMGNYFEAYATTLSDNCDKNYAYVGGIAGRSSGLISYCVSSKNTFRCASLGSGKADNIAKADAIAGGLVGRISNIAELKEEKYKKWQVKDSYAYSNDFCIWYTSTTQTDGASYVGGIAGQAVANEDNATFSNVYTCDEKNKYAGCSSYNYRGTVDASPEAVQYLNGISQNQNYDSLDFDELLVSGSSTEYIAVKDNDLVITMPDTFTLSGGQQEYVHGDSINPEGIKIQGAHKQYNRLTGEYDDVIFNHFKISLIHVVDQEQYVSEEYQVANTTTKKKTINNIGITTFGGKMLDTYQATVSPVVVEELIISRLPFKTGYYCGEEFSENGLILVAKCNDGTVKELTAGDPNSKYEIKGYNPENIGEQVITVSYSETYGEGDTAVTVTVSTTFTVTVYRVKPAYISIFTDPDKTNYAIGEEFDSTGATFTLGYNNGNTETISAEDVVFSGFSSAEEGSVDVNAAYSYFDEDTHENVTLSDVIHVNVGTVDRIEINTLPDKLSYYTSAKKLVTDGLSINVHYNNGVVKTVENSKAIKLSNYDLSVEGIHNVKVEYQGFTDTFEIEVLPVTLSSIEIKTLPKTKFYIPDVMTTSGMALTLNYVDGSSRAVYDGFITTVEGYEEGKMPQFMTTGRKKVTVAYEEDGIRRYTSYDITISNRAVTEIQVVYMPLKQIYKQNEEISTDGLVIYGVYNNGEVFEIKDYTILSVDTSTVGTKTVNVVYMGSYRTSFEITVVAPERIYIENMPDKTIYTIGETFDPTGLVVKAVYWDYSEVVLNENTYILSEPALDDYGSEKVTVTYGSLNTSFYVQIMEFEVPEDAPKILIDSVNATIGKTVVVNICIANNPGIASMKLNVDFDETVLTLTDVTYNSEMGGQSQQPQDMTAPLILNWYNGWDDYIGDCIFATLTFEVSENATHNSISYVSVSYDPEDVYNILEENVTYYAEGGVINVIEYVPGDINDDGELNNKDATRLFQYLSGWDVEVCEKALDVNGDGNVNNKDMTRLFQYLSGWDVEIH